MSGALVFSASILLALTPAASLAGAQRPWLGAEVRSSCTSSGCAADSFIVEAVSFLQASLSRSSPAPQQGSHPEAPSSRSSPASQQRAHPESKEGGAEATSVEAAVSAAVLEAAHPESKEGGAEATSVEADVSAAVQEAAHPESKEVGAEATSVEAAVSAAVQEAAHPENKEGRAEAASVEGAVSTAVQEAARPESTEGGAEATSVEAEVSTAVQEAVSIMLVCTVAFMMLLFYMLNFPDDDVRYYSSHTLENAISIFVAVLIYEAVNDCITWSAAPAEGNILRFGLLGFWFLLLQGSTAWAAGAMVGTGDMSSDAPDTEVQLRTRELRLIRLARMLAHIVGFAAISAWTGLQSEGGLGRSALRVTLVVPIAAVVMLGLCLLSFRARHFICHFDDKIELSEELWDNAAEDAEGDAVSLALSFIFVNAIQFFVLGVLPDRHGGVEVDLPLEVWRSDIFCMLLGALVAGVATLLLVLLASWIEREHAELASVEKLIKNFASSSFAWFLLYAIRGLVHHMYQHDIEHIVPKLLTAFSVSVVVFLAVIVLDIMADSIGRGTPTQQATVKVIMSLGVLMGFAWEMCFSKAIDSIDEKVQGSAKILSLALSAALIALVIPVYLLHIAPITEAYRRKIVESEHGEFNQVLRRSHFSQESVGGSVAAG